jgi:hypothetical protein
VGQVPKPKKTIKKTQPPGRTRFARMALIVSATLAVVAAVAGFRTNLASLFTFYLGFSTPDVELAWLNASQIPPQIGEPITLDPDNIDADTRRVRLPLLLAVRNKESRVLRLTSVEVSVGDTIQLRSPSLARLEPGRVVREHAGAILQPSSSFLPLSPPDTLILPITTTTMGWLILSDKKMPLLFPWLVAVRESSLIDTTTIPIDVSLYFEGRPKYSEQMRFRVLPLLDPRWPRGRAVLRAPATDRHRFVALAKGAGQDRARWREVYFPTGDTIDYRRAVLGGAGYQTFTVGGLLRYVAADTNSDNLLDFELLDVDGDGHVDYRAVTRGWARRVVRWGPDVVRVNQRVNRGALLYMARRVNEMVH